MPNALFLADNMARGTQPSLIGRGRKGVTRFGYFSATTVILSFVSIGVCQICFKEVWVQGLSKKILIPAIKKTTVTNEGSQLQLTCGKDSILNIRKATWGTAGGKCSNDTAAAVQKKCENKASCTVIPHKTRKDGNYLALGAVCGKGAALQLDVTSYCWYPCPLYSSLLPGNKGCKAEDQCKISNGGCPADATCSDGVGKKATCTCNNKYSEYKTNKCVAVDQCAKKNGGCPADSKCTDGLGKKQTCQCNNKYFEHQKTKCVAVDQCKKNNGGCDSKATCSDGLGKEPTCACPKSYKLEGKKKCVAETTTTTPSPSTQKKEGDSSSGANGMLGAMDWSTRATTVISIAVATILTAL